MLSQAPGWAQQDDVVWQQASGRRAALAKRDWTAAREGVREGTKEWVNEWGRRAVIVSPTCPAYSPQVLLLTLILTA